MNMRHVHFIGIGGIGISALAYLALAEGQRVTGSDCSRSVLIEDLEANGAYIVDGHSEKNVSNDVDKVIYSEAIDRSANPEYLKAKELGIPTMSYFEALGELSRRKKTVLVAGTHGKTTTTAMLGAALRKAGKDPTIIVGSKVPEFGYRNLYIGKDDWLVAEACEYRRSFLNLQPFGMVLLNCEVDHLDYYKNEEDYLKAYTELIQKIPKEGFLVANMDDKNVKKIAQYCVGTVIPVNHRDVETLGLTMKVPGEFNRMNATQAFKTANWMGADKDKVKEGLEAFGGTWRRLELKGTVNGATVIDDYGHHPTEIKVTLRAIKQTYPSKKLICVFQPHQYSRTHHLLEDFKEAFGAADHVIITDIYEARDSKADKNKVNAEKLAKRISEKHPSVVWGKDLANAKQLIRHEVGENDVVVIMGAGDISQLANELVE